MTVASMESVGRRRDVVFTTEIRKDGGWRITANELARPTDPFETAARTVYTSNQRISFLQTAKEGSVIVAASKKRVLIGSLRSTEYSTIDKIRYEFRVFESAEFISSLDLKVSARRGIENLGKSVLKRLPVVDVVVGGVKGSIFVHNDLLGNLARSQDDKLPQGISLIPRKLHWHRKEVCTVKWSLDGMRFLFLDETELTKNRQLHYFRWYRNGPCTLATRHWEETIFAPHVCHYSESRCIALWKLLWSSTCRQFDDGSLSSGIETNRKYCWYSDFCY